MQVKYGLLVDATKESTLTTEKHFRNQKRRELAAIQKSHNCVSRLQFPVGTKKKLCERTIFVVKSVLLNPDRKLINQIAPFNLANSQP